MTIRQSAVRRERAREHTRRDILLSAAAVFARRGYAAATLQELADAAGFAAPSLYRYFESKEEIFRSLVELVVGEMDTTFAAPADRTQPLAARIEGLFAAQGRLGDALRPAMDLLQHAGPDLPGMGELGTPGGGSAYYEGRLLEWLERNAASSELRHPPEIVARVLTGIAFAFRCNGEARLPGPELARLVVDLAFHGIAAPAAAPERSRT